ncbi:MAG: type II toxin-antitoxin system VapC family toxin [Gemmatimonadaceae bacterium]
MIFLDSNIPMYLVGAEHPNKHTARRLLESCINRNERLVTSAAVLQEILHRYVSIKRRDAIQPAFDALLNVVDQVYTIETRDVERAKTLLLGVTAISARDALHVAVMQRYDIPRIMSFDAGFDSVSSVERVWE